MTPYTRRDFAKLALLSLPAAGLISAVRPLRAAEAGKSAMASGKPNSTVNGVTIGLNVPYSFGNNAMPADEVLANCVALGVSGLELRTQPVEVFLGAPSELVNARGGRGGGATNGADKLREWRTSVDVSRAAEFRRKYEDAGVFIGIVKVDGIFKMSEGELDYAFKLGKGLGARALSTEIATGATRVDDMTRIGAFADKHKLMIGYHGHTHTGPKDWEEAFALAKYNGANVDIGHYVAGLNTSPVPFIKERHDRITHVHVKDKKMNEGPAIPFGTGDTPITEVLHLIRDNKWPIQATIEFEYKVPEGSTRMAEIAKTVKYCRDALA
jgi:sugar phosphate isomerase/epimerase